MWENKQGWLAKPNASLERFPEDVMDRKVICLSNNKIKALKGTPSCNMLETLVLSGNHNLHVY